MTETEATAEDQLDTLLREGRISPEDYDTLHKALSQGGAESGEPRRAATQGRLTKKWAGRQLGGVCAGLAEFFGLDAWSVRAAFVLAALLSGGTALIVYLVLYFTLPWSGRDDISLSAEKKRRGASRGFLTSLVALWGFGLFFHLWLVPPFLQLVRNAGRPLPTPVAILVRVGDLWGTYFALNLQVLCLGLIYLAYRLAPAGGAVRRWLPRALMTAVLLYLISWYCAWVSIGFWTAG